MSSLPTLPATRAIARLRSRYAAQLEAFHSLHAGSAGNRGELSTGALQGVWDALASALPEPADRLRVLRQGVFLHLYAQDVEQGVSLEVITHGMSTFAEFALARAQAYAFAGVVTAHGVPTISDSPDAKTPLAQLWLLGMGKLGGRELNISSDIDLVAVYDHDGRTYCSQPGQTPISTQEFFCLQVKALHEMLHAVTTHGFVFRVDWMLRPYGRDGLWAMSLSSLAQYFARAGREWERFAWLKARVLGDATPLPLREVIHRFVFRRFLDHQVFAALRQLHALIRCNASGDKAWRDIKLGRGGIREIEFAAQVQQIVRGGAQPELLIRTTLGALKRLETTGLMTSESVQVLSVAYVFLRRLEHRIQYLDDAQTHEMPRSVLDQAWLAQAMGFSDAATLQAALDQHRGAVARIFQEWVQDSRPTAIALEDLVRKAAWTSDFLRKHPDAADALRDPSILQGRFDARGFEQTLCARKQALQEGGLCDEEALIHVLRRAQKIELFRTLVRDCLGEMSVRDVADDLSNLADVCLKVALRWAWEHVPKRHVLRPQMAVLAYGKLGGKELGYGSDLDIVFIYDDPHEDAPENYTRLVRKFITWLTAKTAEGDLYEIDTALRPNGNAGLLVTSLSAFEHYQLGRGANTAWTWEHQAMTRARCAVSLHRDAQSAQALRARLESIRAQVLATPRDQANLAQEVVAMRQKLREAYALKTPECFDIKHSQGGLLDAEFVVQYLVLAFAKAHPELLDNVGNIALLRRAELAGLLPAGLGFAAADAYATLRDWQHAARLQNQAARLNLEPKQKKIPQRIRALWDWVFKA